MTIQTLLMSSDLSIKGLKALREKKEKSLFTVSKNVFRPILPTGRAS